MSNADFAGLTALTVDDSRGLRALMVAMLNDLGVGRVTEAGNGAQALRAIDDADGEVDVVFCDLEMPGIDGVDTMRGIAARQPDCGLVIVSSFDHKLRKTVANLGTELGLNVLGVMGKPFEQAEVARLLEKLTDTRRPVRRRSVLKVTAGELEEALAQDRLDVFYQPKVCLRSGRVVGVEALARMQHPTLGTLLPDTFIPVAESSGTMVPLTLRVAEKAFEECARWARTGLDLTVAINLSASSLRKIDMPETLSGLAIGAGLSPERIVLELTETELGEATDLMHVVTRFRIKRFRFSIDDFGSGHSGLQRLRRLPFTELKIDQSFVQGISEDPEQRAIVESTVRLGRRLGMDIVAEGVEEACDWEGLRTVGCDYAQGYFMARPMASTGIAGWAADWRNPKS